MCLYKRYANGYLNCIYNVDTNVDIKPEYCSVFSSIEVLEHFVAYRDIGNKSIFKLDKDEIEVYLHLIDNYASQ